MQATFWDLRESHILRSQTLRAKPYPNFNTSGPGRKMSAKTCATKKGGIHMSSKPIVERYGREVQPSHRRNLGSSCDNRQLRMQIRPRRINLTTTLALRHVFKLQNLQK